MRSSKSRSRGKSNRNRNPGNNLNRVFDSSGPEGKVRGTPQQIIDKYTQLARDAALANDRVAAENFLQHAEHYTRLLGEAQRQVEARRAQAEQANRERQQREREEREARLARQEAEAAAAASDLAEMPRADAGGLAEAPQESGDSGLVETPESKPRRTPRIRKPRVRAVSKGEDDKAKTGAGAKPSGDGPTAPEAAE